MHKNIKLQMFPIATFFAVIHAKKNVIIKTHKEKYDN